MPRRQFSANQANTSLDSRAAGLRLCALTEDNGGRRVGCARSVPIPTSKQTCDPFPRHACPRPRHGVRRFGGDRDTQQPWRHTRGWEPAVHRWSLQWPTPRSGCPLAGRTAGTNSRLPGCACTASCRCCRGPPEPWTDESLARALVAAQAAADRGSFLFVALRELTEAQPGSPEEAMLQKVVTQLAPHPGMGIWKGADEPWWSDVPVEEPPIAIPS